MNHKTIGYFIFGLSLLTSTLSFAWQGHGSWHEGARHHHGYGHDYPRSWPYRDGFYFSGGRGPNVIIHVPTPAYVPECHNLEVCNAYGNCWLESRCD